MKIARNGSLLLAGIVRSYVTKRAEKLSCELLDFFANPKTILLERFLQFFPMDAGLVDRLVTFTKTIGKEHIDQEAVALFFGGEEYAKYIGADIKKRLIHNGMAMVLLIFHMLLPVEIKKRRKSGLYDGLYLNNSHEIILKNIQPVLCDKFQIELGQMVFVHHGYIIGRATEKLYPAVLEAQYEDGGFVDALMGTEEIDFEKWFPTFLMKT
jgi:hypothetical protein